MRIAGLNQRTGKFGIVPIAFLDVKVPLAPSPTVHKKNTNAGMMWLFFLKNTVYLGI